MNICLNIIESEYLDDRLDQVLASLYLSEPAGKGELVWRSLSNRQYKKILPEINVIKEVRFQAKTFQNINFDLSHLRVVIHISN